MRGIDKWSLGMGIASIVLALLTFLVYIFFWVYFSMPVLLFALISVILGIIALVTKDKKKKKLYGILGIVFGFGSVILFLILVNVNYYLF